MKYPVIFLLLGRLLGIICGLIILPAGVALYYHEVDVAICFAVTSGVVFIVALFLVLFFREARTQSIGAKDSFLLVTLSWLLSSLLGALPFYLSGAIPTFIDAFFEATSGFTTTGATVLPNVEDLPKGILFWRSLTQWIGGMGIIVFAIAILPQLSIGGMQLMKNEMPGPSFEQIKPRIKQTALSLWKIYLLFSVLAVFVFYFSGMSIFDSICHMFTAVGTGGFSTKNGGIRAFESLWIEIVVIGFMFLGGINFILHYNWLRGNFKKMFLSTEWRLYCTMLLVCFALITFNLSVQGGMEVNESIRLSVFQVTTLASSTGYTTADYDTWPFLSKGILFLLMIVGGCAGSTSGGLKQVRLLLLFKKAKQAIIKHIFPKAIVPVKLDRRTVPEEVLNDVSSLFLIYMALFYICTLLLLTYNIDFVSATSAVVACLSNIGPAFGIVGPSQSYAVLPDLPKLILATCMIIGRLEIFTVLVLFFPSTWRK